MDPKYLDFALDLDPITDVDTYDDLTDSQFSEYLELKSEECKDTIYIETLEKIAEQEFKTQPFVTPDGIYTPKIVLHSTTNSVTHMHATRVDILPFEIRPHVVYCLDGMILPHETETGLSKINHISFTMCAKKNIKLHTAKCTLFTKSIHWFGRLVSREGIRYD